MYREHFSAKKLGLSLLGLVLASGCGSTDGDDEAHLGESRQASLIAPALHSVATAREHSLALRPDGTVWAWGHGWYGALGTGTNTSYYNPVWVDQVSGAIAVAAGDYHSMALGSDGTVWTWGDSRFVGRTGTGAGISAPAQLAGIYDAVSIAAGSLHSLVLRADGTVWAWGMNFRGQLGDGTILDRSTPGQVQGLSDVVAIAAGEYHNLAVRADGSVWAWGKNSYGQLGDGSTTDRRTPVQVQGLPASPITAVDVGVGYDYSLAVLSDGTLWSWGANNNGQLGNGSYTDSLIPVEVEGLADIVLVDGGPPPLYHTTALASDGTVWSWGNNVFGQLASGTSTCFDYSYFDSVVPVASVGLSDVVSVSAGDRSVLVQKSDGSVWAWGDNSTGRWGDGTTSGCSPVPREVMSVAP